MEGIRLTGQTLFSEEDVQSTQQKTQSVMTSKSVDVNWGPDGILRGKTTLNSYEVEFYPMDKGTRLEVNYGLTTLGLILGIIFLFFGLIIGLVILLLWYMKMEDVKESLRKYFPGYMPPGQQQYQQQGPGQQQQQYNR